MRHPREPMDQGSVQHEVHARTTHEPSSDARYPYDADYTPRVAVMGWIIRGIAEKMGEDSVSVHEMLVVWFKAPKRGRRP
jgi:hypothetical protein